MSKLPIFELFLSARESQAKTRVVFQAETQAEIFPIELDPRVGDGKWTAIGMSENAFMPRSDLVVGYVKPDGTGVVEDRWAGAYAPPLADASQGRNSIALLKSRQTFQQSFYLRSRRSTCGSFF